ncbi:MAG: hypothetical protein UW42_C0004G0033 [Candidatus Collierbacteria bacterium GW2011_GWB1_44_197]|nr:MAG: hypothetical protein UW42_C0004G0033 [Candidatus Collierbacteria bacterium GW2011_GWB1_44_197]KKT61850.1 MAG: hypothetical protein UW56_C0017G0033 [Candidatus Collierbacteria bacterium GW2011_GWD1_44_27]
MKYVFEEAGDALNRGDLHVPSATLRCNDADTFAGPFGCSICLGNKLEGHEVILHCIFQIVYFLFDGSEY